jgi:hypothetical protein
VTVGFCYALRRCPVRLIAWNQDHRGTDPTAIAISDQQLQELETRRRPAVIARDRRKKKGYAVLPEAIYDQARPVIEFVAAKVDDAANETDAWTEDKTLAVSRW